MRAKLFCLAGLLGVLCLVAHVNAANFWAGVSKIDATMPIGAPLAGYNYPPRRHDNWPIPTFNGELYTTWMTPSKGKFNPTWAKCVVLSNGQETFAFVTVDVIGADGTLAKLAYDIAITQGFNVTFQNFMLSGSHTHSGPGAITAEFLWSIAPATDAVVPELQNKMAQYIAKAMVEAYRSMEPAVIDFGLTNLTGVTHNRRSGFSPYVQDGTIDPNLGVVRIDKPDGTPLATIWNYAIHGICFDAGNLFFSSDVMGSVCQWIEDNVGGLAVFWNGDAGDISPIFSVCCQDMPNFSGGPVIGQAVAQLRSTLKPTNDVQMWSAQNTVDFGVTVTNFTLARLDNCTQGGPMNICSICEVLDCDLNLGLGSAWIENQPVFSAFRFLVNNKNTILTSIPGEALVELGWNIRNDTADLGYDQTFLVGYTNNHLGYFCTPNEYDIGGYESTLTLWGINTAQMIQDGCYSVTSVIAPNPPKAIIATVDENSHQTRNEQQEATQ